MIKERVLELNKEYTDKIFTKIKSYFAEDTDWISKTRDIKFVTSMVHESNDWINQTKEVEPVVCALLEDHEIQTVQCRLVLGYSKEEPQWDKDYAFKVIPFVKNKIYVCYKQLITDTKGLKYNINKVKYEDIISFIESILKG